MSSASLASPDPGRPAHHSPDLGISAHIRSDDEAMVLAIHQAMLAEGHSDVPVGAIVTRGGAVIAARHNERELTGDPTAHAEILAIRDAAAVLGNWHLDECTLYVTLEPCTMCAGAMVNARVERVVYGATDPKAGAAGSLYNLLAEPRLNHRCIVATGVRADECGTLLKRFFGALRSASRNRESAATADAVDQTT